MRGLRRWLREQLEKLLLMPDYFRSCAKQWMNILFGETLVGVAFLLWWALANPPNSSLIAVFVAALFFAGYYAWRAENLRLRPRISVSGVHRQQWRTDWGMSATAYYFELTNGSEGSTVRNVRVQLKEMVPPASNFDWLPVPLRQKHDNPLPGQSYARNFDLNPSEPKHIDFVSSIEGTDFFDVEHIAGKGVNQRVQISGRHRLRIMITAENTPPQFAWFRIWKEDGVLQCEME